MSYVPALLVLEDGRSFLGRSFGALGTAFGAVSIFTDFAAYQAALADPGNAGRVLVAAFPHIGNTGWVDDAPQTMSAAGLVIRDAAPRPSSWRATSSLDEQLRSQGMVAICDLDTRALIRHIHRRGEMRAAISTTELNPATLQEQLAKSSDRKDS